MANSAAYSSRTAIKRYRQLVFLPLCQFQFCPHNRHFPLPTINIFPFPSTFQHVSYWPPSLEITSSKVNSIKNPVYTTLTLDPTYNLNMVFSLAPTFPTHSLTTVCVVHNSVSH